MSLVLDSTLYVTFLYFTFLGFQAFVIGICSASTLVVRKYAGASRKKMLPSAYKSRGTPLYQDMPLHFLSIQVAKGQAALWSQI
jgi:hypothetical protein